MTAPRGRTDAFIAFIASIAPFLLAACVAPGSLFGPPKDQGPAFRDPRLSLQAASAFAAPPRLGCYCLHS